MGTYKMTRTTLQFDKKFIKYLEWLLKEKKGISKNHYIMQKCGYNDLTEEQYKEIFGDE